MEHYQHTLLEFIARFATEQEPCLLLPTGWAPKSLPANPGQILQDIGETCAYAHKAISS